MDIKAKIEKWIKETLETEGNFVLEHPTEFAHGDYSTNIALVLKTDARELSKKLESKKLEEIEKIEVAGPGFINIFLKKEFFAEAVREINEKGENYGKNENLSGQKVIIEYTNTNVLKPMHIGHLMGNVIGESLSRIIESSGAEIKRDTYEGDQGLHVAKAVWGIIKSGGTIEGGVSEKTKYIGEAYTLGSNAYEDNPEAQEEIKEINKKIFEETDQSLIEIYKWGRQVSLAHFEELYKKLGTKFDFYFFESEISMESLKIVQEFLKSGLFEESEGATVFKAEKLDPKLHTRVFVTNQGLPTYEAKDIAHAIRKFEKYNSDKSIIVTANEQSEYFKVVLRALKEIKPEIANQTMHVPHGILKLPTGKMSSRKGNVITGESLIEDVEALVKEKIVDRGFEEKDAEHVAEMVAVGAIKYSILRQALGGDIIFDFDKSISFEGDSGPYLQYTAVRANSVLQKSEARNPKSEIPEGWQTTDLEKYLYRFPEIVVRAGLEYAPHYLVTYLIELASLFNSFYAKEQILDENDPSSPYKIALTAATSEVLKNGLNLLGIKVPEKM